MVQSQDLAAIWEFEYSADLPEVLGCPGEGYGPLWLEVAMTAQKAADTPSTATTTTKKNACLAGSGHNTCVLADSTR